MVQRIPTKPRVWRLGITKGVPKPRAARTCVISLRSGQMSTHSYMNTTSVSTTNGRGGGKSRNHDSSDAWNWAEAVILNMSRLHIRVFSPAVDRPIDQLQPA